MGRRGGGLIVGRAPYSVVIYQVNFASEPNESASDNAAGAVKERR
jgi:hypothetical protein